MEDVFQWLASWVSVDNNNGAGRSTGNGGGGGGTVRATDFKETIIRSTFNDFDNWKMGTSASFVRLAGVSGAMAICFGAYGAHGIKEKPDMPRERVLAFDTGNRYHLLHSVALLASPFGRYPLVTGALFTVGTTIFSGTCYYYALTGQGEVRRATPWGGIILILAWLSLVA